MWDLEAWENQLFDEYNGERKSLPEIEADLYDELDYEGWHQQDMIDMRRRER